jgi:hypothetical protein
MNYSFFFKILIKIDPLFYHRKMEILGIEPKITKCKFAVLPFKLYPLYPKNDLNVYDLISES